MTYPLQKLASISSMKTGKLNSNAAVENGIYPFFTCAQETYRINTAAFNTEAVLLGGNNANGIYPLKYYRGEFNAYQRTYIFETLDKEKLNVRYLYYALKPALKHFQASSIGAATQYLTKPVLDNFEIPLPEVDVQTSIVETLSAYDDLIENNRRRIQLLEESARLLYQEWFVHLCFPGHEQVKIIDGVPEGWVSGVVSDFFDTSSGGTPSRKVPEYYTGDIPWVKTQELNDGYIFTTSERITEEAIKKSSAKLFPAGTVLIAMYGATIGETGVLAVDAASNQACCALFPKHEELTPEFTHLFAMHSKQGLINLSQGAAQNNISQQVVRNYPFIMPSELLLKEFNEVVSNIYKQKANLEKQNASLAKARDLLLPKLMSGELTV